jgi:hypothetical protein
MEISKCEVHVMRVKAMYATASTCHMEAVEAVAYMWHTTTAHFYANIEYTTYLATYFYVETATTCFHVIHRLS